MECFAVLFGSGTSCFLSRTHSHKLGVPRDAVQLEYRPESRRFWDWEGRLVEQKGQRASVFGARAP